MITKEQVDHIKNIYSTFWKYTIEQFKESNQSTGIYFWVKKEEGNSYLIFNHGENGLTNKEINMNVIEFEIIKAVLTADGFIIDEMHNKTNLLLISKEKIETKTKVISLKRK